MRVFVTGGTGLLGNNILRQLSDAGHHSIAMVRGRPDPEVFEGIEVEFSAGGLNDRDVIDQAVASCDAVIHSAGLIHLGWTRTDESMRVNRDGTRAIVDACIKHDRKLVHVGTVNTLAIGTREAPADEETPLDHAGGQVPCDYVLSKKAGVEEVRQGVKRGLRAAIVHPGFMLGPWDWKPSSGRMMLEVGRTWRPIAPSGGCSVCDPRDVAASTIEAIERGGENARDYILAGENLTYKALWTAMAQRMGTRAPLIAAGPLARVIGGWGGDLWSNLTRREGDLNSAAMKISAMFHWHDSSRAKRELGYQPRDASESLDDAAEWMKSRHLTTAS